MPTIKSLTKRQAAFVKWYLMPGPTQFHATRSARLAGYRWPSKQGSRLLTYPAIATMLEYGLNLMAAEPISCPHCGAAISPVQAVSGDVHVDFDASHVGVGYPGSESTEGGDDESGWSDLEAFGAMVRHRRGD